MNSSPMQMQTTEIQMPQMQPTIPPMQQTAAQMQQTVQQPQPMNISRLNELVREVDPTVQLDEEVEETLLAIADDFIDNVVKGACSIAKHRHVPTIEVRDVQILLERKYNMWIPGFGTEEVKPFKRTALTDAHKQRLALIRRTLKKY